MTPLPELKTLVDALPEVYQPIFGHPELSRTASRDSEDRLRHVMTIHNALARQLQRPVRVLDLGCAQGWFGFNLAHAGAQVLGVDYLAQNVNVCNMLVLENRHLHIRFNILEIEKVPELLRDDQFDLVLGLSVFHHLCYHNGKEATRDLLGKIFEKVPSGIFEMALDSEPVDWAPAQPKNSDYLIKQQPFCRVIAQSPTHLSTVSRPLYFCSRHYWYFDGDLGEFSSHADNGKGRRYFFGEKLLAKLYDASGDMGETNSYAIAQSANFLKSPPAGYEWAPKLIQSGEDNGTAWLVQEKLAGVMLSELIKNESPYDERGVLLGVLRQLAALEKSGLYHADVRVWNILMMPDNFPALIDYNEVSKVKQDCVWPDSPFLAFTIFVNEVVSHRQFETEPLRPPFISPYNLPEPYRSWISVMWSLPVSEWSFAGLLKTLEEMPASQQLERPMESDTANALWKQSIEQHVELLNETMRSMSQLVMRLHEVVFNNIQAAQVVNTKQKTETANEE